MTVGAWGFAMNGIVEALHQDFLDRLELTAHATYIAMPLIGLLLGLFGKLPGTHSAQCD